MSRTENTSTETTEVVTHSTTDQLNREGFVKPIELAKALGVKPQMVYQYIRKGRLATIVEPHTGKILIQVESAAAWLTARDQRAADKAAAEQAELEAVEA